MKRAIGFILFCILLLFIFNAPSMGSPVLKGGRMPLFNLPIPVDPVQKRYLGLPVKRDFKIPDIKAKAVIVYVFTLYCPTCHSSALEMVEMFYKVQTNTSLKDKMKFIGIGAGNSPQEVNIFKETYSIPFPLFPDKDFQIHQALGNVRTPYLIAVKIEKGKEHQVVHAQVGGAYETDDFLGRIAHICGLNSDDPQWKDDGTTVSSREEGRLNE